MALSSIITSSKNPAGSNFNCYFLPKALVKLKVFRATRTVNGETRYSFRFEHEVIHTTDTQHRYYLQYHPSAWTDDTVSVEFTPEGFLSRVHTVTEDQTGAVLEKLAELGKKIAETVAGLPDFVDRDMVIEKLIYEVTFDPTHSAQVEMINVDLEKWKSPAKVRFDWINEGGGGIGIETKSFGSSEKTEVSGIFCRPLAAGELSFYTESKAERHYLMIPDTRKVHYVEILRPRWIKFAFSMEFDKGFPKSISVQRPSQALAIVNIPIRILSAIFSIPSKLLPFNINLDNTKGGSGLESAGVQQQIAQQTQMIDLQKQLQTVKQENAATTRALQERGFVEENRGAGTREIPEARERGMDNSTQKQPYLNPKFKYFDEE
jgi:hypothetical protein